MLYHIRQTLSTYTLHSEEYGARVTIPLLRNKQVCISGEQDIAQQNPVGGCQRRVTAPPRKQSEVDTVMRRATSGMQCNAIPRDNLS